MTTLYLVRHALARAPDDLRLPGDDLPLTAGGHRQALALARRLAAADAGAVYSSDALRARQTAEAVAATRGQAVTVMAELREIDFGTWAGRTYAAVIAADPAAAAFFADPTAMTPPGGEPVRDAARRVSDALTAIARGAGGVVIGHGGSLRLALAQALGMPLASAWRLRLDCAHLSIIDWTSAGPIVACLNDGSHFWKRADSEDHLCPGEGDSR